MGKRLELIKHAVPTASRIAVLVDATNSTHARVPGNIEEEARTLKVHFQRIEASTPTDIENAFAAIRADALMIPEGAMFSQNRGRIFEIATRKRSPPSREGSSLTSWRSAFLWSQNCGDMSSISELRR